MMAIPFFVKAAESALDPALSESPPVAEEGVDFKQCMKDLADGEVFAGEEGTPQAPRETAAEAPNEEAPVLDGERLPVKHDSVDGESAESHENVIALLADESAEPAPLPAEIVELIEMYFPLYEGEPAGEQPVALSMSEDCEERAEVPEHASGDAKTEEVTTPAQAEMPKQTVVTQSSAEVEAGQSEPISDSPPVVAQATPGDAVKSAEPLPAETGPEQAPQAEVSRNTVPLQPEQEPLTEAEPVKHEAVRVPVESAQVPAESSVVSKPVTEPPSGQAPVESPAGDSSPLSAEGKAAATQEIPVTTPEPLVEPSTGTTPTETEQPMVFQSDVPPAVEPVINREGMEPPVEPVVREGGAEVASQPAPEAPVLEPSGQPKDLEADAVRVETDTMQPEPLKVGAEAPMPSQEGATDVRPEVDVKRPVNVAESPEADVAAIRKETIEVETGREDAPHETGTSKSEMVERDTPVEVPEATKGLAADLAAAGEAKRPASEGSVAKPVESQNFLENKAISEGEDRVVSDLLEADGRTQQAVQPDAKTAETQAATGMEATVENKAERTIEEPVREDAATVELADAVRTPVETSTGEQGESGLGGDFERKYTPPQRKVGANTGEAFSAVMESPAASTGNAQPITAARLANGEASVERAEQFQQVLERLDRAVLDAATESDHTMTITLLPRELGRLVLNCEEHQGQMTVELVAEDGQVCQTLREQETALRDMLQQSGYELSRFDVRDQRGGQQERGTFEQARDRTPRRRQAGRVEAGTATAGSSAPAGVGAAGQGVWYVA